MVECLTEDPGVAGFEAHLRHCFVSLRKTLHPLLRLDSNQEDPPDMTEKMLTGK